MLTAFIMAGGSGERFWPLSTKERPKQLLKLISEKSMIRETVDRILPIIPAERIFIGTNSIQEKGIKAELPFLPEENIIIEPLFKDTAAAIGFGAIIINEKYPDAEIIVLASDHLIKNEENFRKRVLTAVEASKKGDIITLGIKPTKPETGYGYIETKECYIGEPAQVIRFWEKPSYDRAEEYVEAGNYLWNSGMFIFQIKTILESIENNMPNHWEILLNIKENIKKYGANQLELSEKITEEFEKFEKISIDFGVMERARNIKVIPVDFGWNDIGSFPALDEVFEKNENGNIAKDANVVEIDSNNNIVISDKSDKKIATIGINNMIIVNTKDALLVCAKKDAQYIKKVLKK